MCLNAPGGVPLTRIVLGVAVALLLAAQQSSLKEQQYTGYKQTRWRDETIAGSPD